MKNNKSEDNNLSRRKFLKAFGTTSVGILATPALLSGMIKDTNTTPVVATATVTSYNEDDLKEAVKKSIENIGGLEDIITPGAKVGIKINLTGGSSHAHSYKNSSGLHPGDSYWTNPTLLKVVGQAIKDAGASKIYIMEAIYDWESVDEFGYSEVIDYLEAEFIDLNMTHPYSDYIKKSVGDKRLIYQDITLNGIFNDIDCFISMPKAKRHESAGITHGMKNLVGILPIPSGLYNDGKGHRAAIHNHRKYDNNKFNNLCRVLIDLNRAAPIHLVVNDAVKTVLGSEGPWTSSGITPATFDKLIIGKDPVAVDSVSTSIMGFNPMADDYAEPFKKNINYLKLATEQGLGEYDLNKIDVVDYVTSTEEIDSNVPNAIHLHSNYPNPFNPATTIKYSLPELGRVKITVYNSLGQKITTLVNGEQVAGTHKVIFDASNFASGIYICTLRVGNYQKSIKMNLAK